MAKRSTRLGALCEAFCKNGITSEVLEENGVLIELWWGYSPAFYQSGRLKMHRFYPKYYLKDSMLNLKDIKILLEMISKTDNRWGYDKNCADEVKQMYLREIQ